MITGNRHLGSGNHYEVFAFDVIFVGLVTGLWRKAGALKDFARDHIGDIHRGKTVF